MHQVAVDTEAFAIAVFELAAAGGRRGGAGRAPGASLARNAPRYNHSRLLPIVTTISVDVPLRTRARAAYRNAPTACSSLEECRAGEPASGTSP